MTIDQALAQARTSLDRLTAAQARQAQRQGALLIDIRPEVNRETEGRIPGAIVIDRNVLEWRLDPASGARLADASYDAWVVLFCNEGYASSLAAASLQALGIHRSTDIVGGFRAWRAAGLPVTATPRQAVGSRPQPIG
ncbi:MAG TPA: rhodanese-like domain-containing protein [Mycobacteriales bacterium]|nr:rhodanese-like domain-containing protein [Mycobacteriales bacterium]